MEARGSRAGIVDVVLKGALDSSLLKYSVNPDTLIGGIIQKVAGNRLRLQPGTKVNIKNDIAEVIVPKT